MFCISGLHFQDFSCCALVFLLHRTSFSEVGLPEHKLFVSRVPEAKAFLEKHFGAGLQKCTYRFFCTTRAIQPT